MFFFNTIKEKAGPKLYFDGKVVNDFRVKSANYICKTFARMRLEQHAHSDQLSIKKFALNG